MSRPRRIGLLGGTFDPIHLGHLALASAARAALALDDVRVVPARVPPHRPQPGASVYHRFAMAALAAVADPHLKVDDIEAQDPERTYTAVTLRRLHAAGLAPSQIFFIAGADAFAEIATWRDYPHVLEAAHFVVISRGGRTASSMRTTLPELASRMIALPPSGGAEAVDLAHPSVFLIDTPIPPISSTAIRARIAEGLSLDGHVPPMVADHIARHDLYRRVPLTHGPDGAARELHEQESV
jgi:nicotinate-nucleotide adenylyltransferase